MRECCKGDDASQWENGKFVTDKDQVFASAVWYQEWHPAHKTSQQNFLLRTSTCDCQVTGLYLGCRAADCIPGQVVYTRASVTKQYNLVVANGRWCSAAWEVTASLAESNGSLLTALVTCGLTAEDRNQLRNITLISSMEPRLGEWRCPADQGLPQNWPFKLCVCVVGICCITVFKPSSIPVSDCLRSWRTTMRDRTATILCREQLLIVSSHLDSLLVMSA